MLAALSRKKWDIIIADYSMPNFGAVDALNLLQEEGLEIPFFIVSGAIGEDVAAAAELFLGRVNTRLPVHDDIWDIDDEGFLR